jgi:hypothetical protein
MYTIKMLDTGKSALFSNMESMANWLEDSLIARQLSDNSAKRIADELRHQLVYNKEGIVMNGLCAIEVI